MVAKYLLLIKLNLVTVHKMSTLGTHLEITGLQCLVKHCQTEVWR